MVFVWFKIDTNNGQAHNDIIEKKKIKILEGKKIHSTHLSKLKKK